MNLSTDLHLLGKESSLMRCEDCIDLFVKGIYQFRSQLGIILL